MNVVDSSGWLEYFSDGPNAKHFSAPLREAATLIVPVISIYEVFKVVLRESGDDDALQAAAAMQKGRVIDLTADIAMSAAKLSLHYNIPMPDSVILATAKAYKCTLWTQDADFKNVPDAKFFPKK